MKYIKIFEEFDGNLDDIEGLPDQLMSDRGSMASNLVDLNEFDTLDPMDHKTIEDVIKMIEETEDPYGLAHDLKNLNQHDTLDEMDHDLISNAIDYLNTMDVD